MGIKVVQIIKNCFMAKDIEDKITGCLNRTPISDGDNLLGFEIDLEMSLINDRDLFAGSSVRRTDDPRCALIGMCKVTDPSIPTGVVIKRLKEMWLTHLAYRHWEAHHIDVLPEQVSLRFVATTGDTSRDLCVTGKIIVAGLQQ
jgi:hypothetical protein